jgi:hypothetical protein
MNFKQNTFLLAPLVKLMLQYHPFRVGVHSSNHSGKQAVPVNGLEGFMEVVIIVDNME